MSWNMEDTSRTSWYSTPTGTKCVLLLLNNEVLIFTIVLLADFGVLYGFKCFIDKAVLLCYGYNLYNRKRFINL